jgi:hypothetical protein
VTYVRKLSYAWAAGLAVPAAALAWTVESAVPPVPVAALLTLVLAQVPLPKRSEPLHPRRRSELDRHLDRRVRRGEAD